MWSKKNLQLFCVGSELTKQVGSFTVITGGHNMITPSLGDRVRNLIVSSFIFKIIANMIYKHNFPFIGWLILLCKHRYFKETIMLELF